MLARFECPRCQTVFTHDKGDDDAFVECPSCGALAMSIGDATGVDSSALARALSSTHDAPTHLIGTPLGSTEDPSSESPERSDEPSLPSDPSGPVARPDPFGRMSAGIFSGLMIAAPSSDVDRSDEGSVDRSDEGSADRSDEGSADRSVEGPSEFFAQGSLDSPTVTDEPLNQASPKEGIDLGLDDDFKDFSLPSTSPGLAALPQKKVPTKKEAKAPAPSPPPSFDDPDPELNDALNDDSFGALEAAFDTMAAKPAAAKRGKDGLSDDDRRFLRGEQESAPEPVHAPPPKRPPARPGQRPPARAKSAASSRASSRPPSRGIALSEEAREAAFLPLRLKTRRSSEAPPDNTVRQPPPRPALEPVEPTDIVPKAARRPVREQPSVMGRLPGLALAAAVLLGLVGGAATGALTAPVAVKRNDARGRAELQLAEGNKFYDAGRFDDALGKYKGAVNIDRTFALAHRAKGAALAKQQRWDEAADAYQEYLGLEGSAIDATDVKEALARRGLVAKAPPKVDGT